MKKRTRGKDYHRLLRTNYAIAFLGTFMMLAIFAVYIASDYRSADMREKEQLRVLASTAASRTENLVDNVLITMKILDSWIQNNPEQDPRFSDEFNSLVDTFRDATGRKIDLRMVTEDGGLFHLPSKTKEALADASDREYFYAQKDTGAGTLFFAEPVISRVTGLWGIPVSFKLSPNKHGLHIIFAAIEFRNFDAIFSDITTVPERSVTIIRKDGIVLQRSPFDEYIVGKQYPFEPYIKTESDNANYRAEKMGEGTVTVYNPEKNVRSVCYVELDDIPLYVMVADSFTRIQRAWLGMALVKIAFALIILAFYILLNLRLISLLRNNDKIQKELETAARYDSLTGLKNRSYFFERLIEETERSKRTGEQLVLLIVDIDHFKYVNDTWGHPVGDRILKEIAVSIENSIRNIDFSGRVGGEEFAILLTGTSIEKGAEIAERMKIAADSVKYGDWKGGVSIGAAEWKGREESIDELFKRADDALYIAKNTGRNRVVTANE